MPLIHITGNAGAGKSTICDELRLRGYEAYDIDMDGITAWYDKSTGKRVDYSREREGRRSRAWIEKHQFKMVTSRIKKFAESAKNKTIFLCGQSIHDHEVWDLFDLNIYLDVDKPTLKHRLANRTSNDFGQTPAELAAILEVHDSFRSKHKNHGAVMIDAHQPVKQIVSQIIETLDGFNFSSGSGRL